MGWRAYPVTADGKDAKEAREAGHKLASSSYSEAMEVICGTSVFRQNKDGSPELSPDEVKEACKMIEHTHRPEHIEKDRFDFVCEFLKYCGKHDLGVQFSY